MAGRTEASPSLPRPQAPQGQQAPNDAERRVQALAQALFDAAIKAVPQRAPRKTSADRENNGVAYSSAYGAWLRRARNIMLTLGVDYVPGMFLDGSAGKRYGEFKPADCIARARALDSLRAHPLIANVGESEQTQALAAAQIGVSGATDDRHAPNAWDERLASLQRVVEVLDATYLHQRGVPSPAWQPLQPNALIPDPCAACRQRIAELEAALKQASAAASVWEQRAKAAEAALGKQP